MRHIVIRRRPGSTVIFHVISQKARFSNTKCVFQFSLHFVSETFLILRINERDVNETVHCTSCTVQYRYSCQILMKL